jgi:diaminohydroxyphosphoribosylaminopyrimidine deaminase/5-amino-6-(5-phosphoribosylamino)uracil reductase
LKWAQSNNGFIAGKSSERIFISNELTNRIVHGWRSEEAAILVGRNTAIADNPALTNRYWPSKPQPIRMVIDAAANLPNHLQLLNDGKVTWIWNQQKEVSENNVYYKKWDDNKPTLAGILEACYSENIQSVLVEGGTNLLQQFIDAGLWDEARIITNTTLSISDGLKAPSLIGAKYFYSQFLQNDFIEYFIPAEHE